MKKLIPVIVLLIYFIPQSLLSQVTAPQPKMTKPILKIFFETNLFYPEKELRSNKQGTVIIEFNVDKEGRVLSHNISQSAGKNLDKEAIRLFNLVEFKPAYNYGIPVAGKGNFKVDFKAKKHLKLLKRRIYKQIPNYSPYDTSNIIYSLNKFDTISKADIDGGSVNLYQYIYSHMKYPPQALKLNIQGEVILDFVVETNGLISNITVNQAVGGGCTEEAIRICKDIKWIPGRKNGLSVRSRNQIKINFKINPDGKPNYVPNQNNSGM